MKKPPKEYTDALAETVQEAMNEMVKVPDLPLVAKDAADLELAPLVVGVEFVDKLLPEMARDLFIEFKNPDTDVKDKRLIFETFAKYALTHERLKKGMGLIEELTKGGGGFAALANVLNININQSRKDNDFDDRLVELIESEVIEGEVSDNRDHQQTDSE